MNEPKDGGPAFPWHQSPGNQDNLGLTKRDWFAGMALQAGLAYWLRTEVGTWEERCKMIAGMTHDLADAMLAERQKQSTEPKP